MENETLKRILTEIKEQNKVDYARKDTNAPRTLYDFVASEYWQMSKEDLKELFLNMNYAIYYYLKDYSNGTDKLADIENMMIDDFIERNCEE